MKQIEIGMTVASGAMNSDFYIVDNIGLNLIVLRSSQDCLFPISLKDFNSYYRVMSDDEIINRLSLELRQNLIDNYSEIV